jgi:hypothetical protein
VGTARIDARVTFGDGAIAAVDTEPAIVGLDQLVGSSAYRGFRRRVGAVTANEAGAHAVGFQLLDDLPIALMLSGRVLRIAGITLGRPDRRPPVDLCAGWVDGGTLVQGFAPLGPPLHDGPVAGAVEHVDDPLAWHDLPAPCPLSTRRVRRLDVWTDDGIGKVDSWFRDTYVDNDGLETVVHEYAVAADVDLRAHQVVAAAAVPATLPAPECPNAVASAARIVGDPVEGLRDRVPSTLRGPSTCTHLNDALRALEDVGALLDALGASTPGGGAT